MGLLVKNSHTGVPLIACTPKSLRNLISGMQEKLLKTSQDREGGHPAQV